MQYRLAMPRTVTARFLRLLGAVRASRAGGPDPLERLAAAPRPTRRAVLAGLGAVAACRRDPAPAPRGGPRVAILGAGFAGLTACHRLADRGLHATVYDARDRVGGRVITGRGLFPSLPGLSSELGAEWINSADAELWSLCEELGLTLRDSWVEFDLEDFVWLDGRRVPARSLVADLGTLADVCDAAMAGFDQGGAAISYANPSGAEALDRTTAAEWFAALPLGADARRYAELVTAADYGLDLDQQSALNPVSFFTSAGEELYDERWLLAGGNDQVATGLAALHEDRIELGRVVEAVRATSGGAWRISFADGEEVTADAVICTLPFSVLRRISLDAELPEVKRRCVDELGYATNAKLMLPFSRRFWRDAGDSGFTINDRFQEGWDGAMMQGLDFGAFATFRGGAAGEAVGRGDVADRGAELLADLETFWPGCAADLAGEGARAPWPDDPWVRGSYACYRPGQWTEIGGAEPEPVGTLFFAGEHTSYEFQGYMNGACESGAAVAADVAAWASGKARLARPPLAARRRPARRA